MDDYVAGFNTNNLSYLPDKKKKEKKLTLNTDTSIVDYLKSIGQDSSYVNRTKIAKEYGIKNYSGTAEQNTSLLKMMKTGAKKENKNNVPPDVQPKAKAKEPAVPKNVKTSNKDLIVPEVKKPIIQPATNIPDEMPFYEQNAPAAYQSPYSSQIDALLNSILNREQFSYDLASDPMYQVYNQQYTQKANLGMRDTMGNAAALTGGYGNTYAGVAGQQTYDNYMSQLNNVIPELYNAALANYQNQIANDYNSLNALQSLENYTYGQYRDSIGDYQTDRNYYYGRDYDAQQQNNWQTNFDYGVSQDELAQRNYEREFDYGIEKDKQAQKNWQTEFDHGVTQDKQAQKNYENEFSYQQGRDAQNQANWQSEFDYTKERDEKDRQEALDKYIQEMTANESAQTAEASAKRIEKYSIQAQEMLNTYGPEEVIDWLLGLNLTDDEIALIVNNNYELRKLYE